MDFVFYLQTWHSAQMRGLMISYATMGQICRPRPLPSRKSEIWKRYWAGQEGSDMPATLHSTVEVMNSRQLPCIFSVLNVFQLLPVTSAEVERAYSASKLIKTKMRSTTVGIPSECRCPALLSQGTSHLHVRQSLTCMPDATQEGWSS